MKFDVKKEINLEIGQKLYGIIATSITTYDGVYSVVVEEIDWNKELVIFKVNQPCEFVACEFEDVECFVFETKEEAEIKSNTFKFGEGMYSYDEMF
jgi:hypothetical protein